jgi:hypothetical protein
MDGKSASSSRFDGQAATSFGCGFRGERHQHLDDEWRSTSVDE